MWTRVIAVLLLNSLVGPWASSAAPADSAIAQLRALEGDWVVRTPESTWSYVFISASNGGPVVSYCPTLSASLSPDPAPRLYNQFGRSTDMVVRICCSSGNTILRDYGRFCADTGTFLWWRDTDGSPHSAATLAPPVGKWVIRGNSLMHWYVSTNCARSGRYYTITHEWLLTAILCRRLENAATETNTTCAPMFWQAPGRTPEDKDADVIEGHGGVSVPHPARAVESTRAPSPEDGDPEKRGQTNAVTLGSDPTWNYCEQRRLTEVHFE